MKLLSLRRLDPRGIAHFVLPLLVIVIIGVIGTYLIVSSSAGTSSCEIYLTRDKGGGTSKTSPAMLQKYNECSACNASSATWSTNGGCNRAKTNAQANSVANCAKQGKTYNASNDVCNPKPAKAPTPSQQTAANKKAKKERVDSSNKTDDTKPDKPASLNPPNTSSPIVRTTPPALEPYITKAGNIIVTVYADKPPTKGSDSQKLGNVRVDLEKVGGGALKCDARKSLPMTNAQKDKKTGKPTARTGTIHFNNCEPGQYKLVLVGRNGYVPAVNDANIKIFNLNTEENQLVDFVMKKGSTGP